MDAEHNANVSRWLMVCFLCSRCWWGIIVQSFVRWTVLWSMWATVHRWTLCGPGSLCRSTWRSTLPSRAWEDRTYQESSNGKFTLTDAFTIVKEFYLTVDNHRRFVSGDTVWDLPMRRSQLFQICLIDVWTLTYSTSFNRLEFIS